MAREMWQGEECHLEVSKESFQVERKKPWQNEQKSHKEIIKNTISIM